MNHEPAPQKPGRLRGKKPVDIVAARGYLTPQDCVWLAIRALRTFSRADLEIWLVQQKYSGINTNTVSGYLTKLLKGGYIVHKEKEPLKGGVWRCIYQLEKDVGIEAPRLTRAGQESIQGRGREQLWRSMKVLGDFDHRDLAIAASTEAVQVSLNESRDYIKHLYKAAYLQLTQPAGQFPARYRLLPSKFTGPKPPMIQRTKRLFDPNLNRVVWNEEESQHG